MISFLASGRLPPLSLCSVFTLQLAFMGNNYFSGPIKSKSNLSSVYLQLGTTIEPTRALLCLCPNLLKLKSPSRPMLFLTHCLADGSVQLPRLQAVHLNILSHKGQIGRHKPMGYSQLRDAMQAIESKMGGATWITKCINLIENAPVQSLSAMEGTSVAAGVQSVRAGSQVPK